MRKIRIPTMVDGKRRPLSPLGIVVLAWLLILIGCMLVIKVAS